ncbi:MAG: hypothetical protein EPO39_04545 [Candidatus Manganitrophaceae bacterium]|nr:MAG: hypothetical protein EPO39_04545 [Candidatus Manganitrophaceae bacterium]
MVGKEANRIRIKQDEAPDVTDGSCDRCGGLMYGVTLLDMKSTQERRIEAKECFLCGNIVDPTILRNRGRSPVGTVPALN